MGVVGFEQRLREIHVRIVGPGQPGFDGSGPLDRVSDGLIVVLLFVDDGRGGAPCELTLAHALQGGIPVNPNRPGAATDVCKSIYHVVEHLLPPTPPSGQRAAIW